MDNTGSVNRAFSTCELDLYSKYQDESKMEPAKSTNSRTYDVRDNNEVLIARKFSRRCWFVSATACLAVIAVVVLVVLLPAIILNAGTSDKDRLNPKKTILMEDILDDMYSTKWFNGTWETDTMFSYMSKSGQVWLHDMEAMTSINLLLNDTLIPAKKFEYSLSADLKYLLVSYNSTKRFRHVFSSYYSIIDLEAQLSTPVKNSLGKVDEGLLQVVSWAPADNGYAYVYHNNLYYRPSASNDKEYNITNTGIPGIVYNGATDWIYNDAVSSSSKAIWFSDNGTKLAFGTYNDSLVKDEPITFYGANQYSNVVDLKYPKVGTTNPNATLSVVDLQAVISGNFTVINIPPPHNVSEPILAYVTWANDDEIIVVWKNRVQNQAWIIRCNFTDTEATCEELWKVEEPEGWVYVFGPPRISIDGTRLLLPASHDQGDGLGKFRHVTIIYLNQSEPRVVALTAGTFTVTDIIAWDEDDEIFFSATDEGDSARVHVFVVSDDPVDAPHVANCVTCGIRTVDGDIECQYSTAYFSKSNSFYMHHCWGPDIPEITFYNRDHERVALWEDNRPLRDLVSLTILPRSMKLEVPLPDGFMAHVRMWLPPKMDANIKYPLLIDVYAGPDSQQISERFEIDWRTYLATNKSIVYAVIDGRGSGLQGDKMMHAMYRRLGTVEVEDQIKVTKFLLKKYEFLDSGRTAIWGWSYGGYSTLKTLANDTQGLFKCGIAVAPVTDWMYYTSIYTERYMGLPTPDDNLEGYKQANVNDKLDNLRHKKLLLIHGTFDNIALYHNSMMFSRAMQGNSIQFEQQSYPDEDHALTGVTHHLYPYMTKFLEECFA